jgi:hypothetical protein
LTFFPFVMKGDPCGADDDGLVPKPRRAQHVDIPPEVALCAVHPMQAK